MRHSFRTVLWLLLAWPLSVLPRDNTVLDIPLGNGVTQRVLYVAPEQPRGILVMLPGGSGEIAIQPDGHILHADNFVVRSRDLWLDRGYGVAILDAPTDRSMRGARSTPAYAALLEQVLQVLQRRAHAPLWLLGTSQGSIGAMNGASHAPPGLLAGVILTESVSVLGHSHETVFSADPAGVQVPALVVANQADHCWVAPPTQAEAIAQAMNHAPSVTVLRVDGGRPGRDPCGSLTAHGYDGIERQVVERIVGWIERQPHRRG